MPVANEPAEIRVCDGDVSVPSTTVPSIVVLGNMAGGRPLIAVAVGYKPVERITLVLELGTGKNIKQHLGEHLDEDSDRKKMYIVVSRPVSTSTYRLPSTSRTSLGVC